MAGEGTFWAYYFREVFIPQVRVFTSFVVDRVLPLFAKAQEEANEVAKREWERLLQLPGDENTDPAGLAERAFDAGLAYYEAMQGVKQALLNLTAVGIYHLFEQQLFLVYRRALLSLSEEHEASPVSLKDVKTRLKEGPYRIDVEEYSRWATIDELRLLSNTVKHGAGPSARNLGLLRPDLFMPHNDADNPRNVALEVLSGQCVPPSQPLAGTDLYVTQEDVTRYADAVEGFWQWLARRMTSGEV